MPKRRGVYSAVKAFKRRQKKVHKIIGTTLPPADRILDRGVERAERKKTMYGPSQNLRKNRINGLLQNVGPFGTRWAGRLKYVDRFRQSSVLGTYNEFLFNMNSLFDPDRSGVGHQPLGFDQLAVVYQRYRVLKCIFKITPMITATNTNMSIVAFTSNNTAALTSVSQALEAGYSIISYSNGSSKYSPLSGVSVLNNLTGNSLSAYRSDDSYQSLVSSSPTELLILHIGIECTGGVTTDIDYYLQLEFDCEFWDPLVIPPS